MATTTLSLAERLRSMSRLLTVRETAEILSEHHITTHKRILRGAMPHIRIGSRVKIDSVTLADWVEARTA